MGLKTFGGMCFPAELFHVHLLELDSERMGHFIGIREFDAGIDQQDFEKRVAPHMIPTTPFRLPDWTGRSGDAQEGVEGTSSSSESSQRSTGLGSRPPHIDELPWVSQISLEFNASSESFIVTELAIEYGPPDLSAA